MSTLYRNLKFFVQAKVYEVFGNEQPHTLPAKNLPKQAEHTLNVSALKTQVLANIYTFFV